MVNFYWATTSQQKTLLASVGFGEHWGIFRWAKPKPDEGWQLGVTGGVFAQFDMHTASKDLLNADYLVGLPLSWRLNKTSARFRIYHQSSHLGDEFLLDKHPTRVNYSYEAAELIASQGIGDFRPYAGGEWLFSRYPTDIKPLASHVGLEFRTSLNKLHLSKTRTMNWVAAIDVKNTQEGAVSTGWDIKTGIELGPAENADRSSRIVSITLEHYRGPSPYSQFYEDAITFTGLGFQLGP
jgi:hypothetical protein